jgi:hypothetical protein
VKANPLWRACGEVTFARFRPRRAPRPSVSSVGAGGEPPPARASRLLPRPRARRVAQPAPPAPAGAPRVGAALRRRRRPPGAGRVGTRKDSVSLFPGRCNLKPPGARGLYLSRNACSPRPPWAASGCLLKNFCPLPKGIAYFNFFLFFLVKFGASNPDSLEIANSPGKAILFLRAFVWGFAVPGEPAPHSRPASEPPCSSVSWCRSVPLVSPGAGHGP